MEQAYGNGEGADFELKKSYVAVQLYKKEYNKALPILEDIFKNGMGTEILKAQLKEAYVGNNGSDKGFNKFLNGLLKESAEKQKEEIRNRMISEPAPLFTLKKYERRGSITGSPERESRNTRLLGNVVRPVQEFFPAMQKAVDKYKNNEDVAFLFIDTWESAKDPLPEVKKFIEEHNYSFNVLFDLKTPQAKTK